MTTELDWLHLAGTQARRLLLNASELEAAGLKHHPYDALAWLRDIIDDLRVVAQTLETYANSLETKKE